MIVQMLNWVHILVLLTIPMIAVAAWFLLKDRSQRSKDIFMWVLMGIVIATYLMTFTTDLITRADYRATILKRLPLHLCGINIFLFPIGFKLRNHSKTIVAQIALSYMYFVGSPGALLGSLMPPSDIVGCSIFTYNVATYFIKHNFIFLIPIMLIVFGYYKPRVKDMLFSAGTLIALMCFMHVVNLIFSAIGGYTVNYFYTRIPDNFVLEIFWNLVPIELLYMFTLIAILVPVFAVYYFSAHIPKYIRLAKTSTSGNTDENVKINNADTDIHENTGLNSISKDTDEDTNTK